MALEEQYPRWASKIQGARDAGYSDSEIDQHLKGKITRARESGYSDEEINEYLGKQRSPGLREGLSNALTSFVPSVLAPSPRPGIFVPGSENIPEDENIDPVGDMAGLADRIRSVTGRPIITRSETLADVPGELADVGSEFLGRGARIFQESGDAFGRLMNVFDPGQGRLASERGEVPTREQGPLPEDPLDVVRGVFAGPEQLGALTGIAPAAETAASGLGLPEEAAQAVGAGAEVGTSGLVSSLARLGLLRRLNPVLQRVFDEIVGVVGTPEEAIVPPVRRDPGRGFTEPAPRAAEPEIPEPEAPAERAALAIEGGEQEAARLRQSPEGGQRLAEQLAQEEVAGPRREFEAALDAQFPPRPFSRRELTEPPEVEPAPTRPQEAAIEEPPREFAEAPEQFNPLIPADQVRALREEVARLRAQVEEARRGPKKIRGARRQAGAPPEVPRQELIETTRGRVRSIVESTDDPAEALRQLDEFEATLPSERPFPVENMLRQVRVTLQRTRRPARAAETQGDLPTPSRTAPERPTAVPPRRRPAPIAGRYGTENQRLSGFLSRTPIGIENSKGLAGELRALRESGAPGAKRAIKVKGGISVNRAVESAFESGFIEEETSEALLDALRRDLAGDPVFSESGSQRQRQMDRDVARLEDIETQRVEEEAARTRARGGFAIGDGVTYTPRTRPDQPMDATVTDVHPRNGRLTLTTESGGTIRQVDPANVRAREEPTPVREAGEEPQAPDVPRETGETSEAAEPRFERTPEQATDPTLGDQGVIPGTKEGPPELKLTSEGSVTSPRGPARPGEVVQRDENLFAPRTEEPKKPETLDDEVPFGDDLKELTADELAELRKTEAGLDLDVKGADDLTERLGKQVQDARSKEKQRGSWVLRDPITAPEPSTGVPKVDKALRTTAARGIADSMRDLKERIFGIFEFERAIKNNPLFQDDIRLTQRFLPDADEKATRAIDAIVGIRELEDGKIGGVRNAREFRYFEQIVSLRDMVSRLRSGQIVQDDISIAEATEALRKLTAEAPKHVIDSVDRHFEMVKQIGMEKVARGWLTAENVRDDYFVHRVLLYQLHGPPAGATPRRLRQPGPEKLAKGSNLAIERDYMRAMHSYVAQHNYKKTIEDFINRKAKQLDRTADIKAERKGFKKIEPGQIVELKDGTVLKGFQFDPGNQFYQSISVKDAAVNKAIRDGLEELGIPIEDFILLHAGEKSTDKIRSALSIGSKKPTYALPVNIANRLERFSGPEHDLESLRMTNRVTGMWKGLTINFAGTAFQLMNFTGDIVNMARADVGAITRIPRAARMLLSRKPDARMLIKLGEELEVLNASFVQKEAGKIVQLPEFKRFLSPDKRALLSPALISDKILAFSNYRENIPRLALFMKNLERVQGGIPELVKRLEKVPAGQALEPAAEAPLRKPLKTGELRIPKEIPPVRAAAKVAREIIVDYGKFTGDENRMLRGFLTPFYSWTKQNTIGWTLLAARNPGRFAGLALAPWAITEIYNNTMYPEVEEGLRSFVRESPHIITGLKDEDGAPIVLSFGGFPPSAAAETLGVGGVPARISDFMTGRMELDEAAREMLKDFVQHWEKGGPALNLLTPFIKTPMEMLTNTNFYTGGKITRAAEEGTSQGRKKIMQRGLEALFRPAREARQLATDVESGEFLTPSGFARSRLGAGSMVAEARGGGFTERFYDQLRESEAAEREHRLLRNQGKRKEANQFLRENRDAIRNANLLRDFNRNMTPLRARTRRLEADEDMDPKQRRLRIENIQKRMNRIAEKALRAVR